MSGKEILYMDYKSYFKDICERNKLMTDTIDLKPTDCIPIGYINLMQHDYLEKIAHAEPGEYKKNPEEVYIKCQQNMKVNILDQFIPRNPLKISTQGFTNGEINAMYASDMMVCDGIVIDSPEAVVEHLEKYEFPKLLSEMSKFNEDERLEEILKNEQDIQTKLGPDILKTGYGFIRVPYLLYTKYGYVNYFMAYALHPEVIEKHFSLQADYALLNNRAAARAYIEGGLPPMYRIGQDMADSRGMLVNIKTLDKLWFPHFTRCIEPVIKAGVKLIWHCDGNLMEMLPRLIDIGIKGFQGFQYEDGMDYEKICKMKTKDGEGVIIWAGVSVTRTLPFGKPFDIKNELKWLVESGPKAGLILKASSSVTPGVPWENIEAMLEGFKYYNEHGRK